MKTLLINPPIREYTSPSNFPIGMGYIAAVMLKNSLEVDVLDIDEKRYSREKVEEIIKNTKCQIAGISSFVTQYKYTKWLATRIRELRPDMKIIIGNSLPTTMADFIKGKIPFDYLVIGEGEETMAELITALGMKTPIEHIKGIAYLKDGNLIMTEKRPFIDVNNIPYPAWHLFNMDYYTSIPIAMSGKQKAARIFSVRGCPYHCKYCYHIFDYTPRKRTVDNIMGEIKELNRLYGVTYIAMSDDLFTVDKKYVMEFCSRVKNKMPWLHWSTTSRINILDDMLIKEMKSAGCDWICAAIESGSQRIMNEMLRGTTVEQAAEAVKLLRDNKVWAEFPFMMGYPTEDEQSIADSVDFCVKNGVMVQFNFVCPYPGTPLFNEPEIRAKITDMEDFMLRIGDGRDFVINLTNFKDEELFELRKQAERKISNAYCRRNLLLFILLSPAKLFGKNVAELIKYCKMGQMSYMLKSYLKSLMKGATKKTLYKIK